MIAEALLAFTLEVNRAARESGLPEAPAVVLADLGPRAYAATVPGEIRLAWRSAAIHERLGARQGRRWLRCIARHEVAHRALGHEPRAVAELAGLEAEVGAFMLKRWRERAVACEGHLR